MVDALVVVQVVIHVWCMVDALVVVQVVIHVWCMVDALVDGIGTC
jgi:hypothetical protein